MKINSVNQQNKQNFRGIAKWIANNPKLTAGIATLAGSSVIAQKVVMSGAEASIGPVMDVNIGKTITNIAKEKDNRTNESSKVQAIRTFSQAVGGTITGVIIRLACITGATLACSKLGEKAGSKIGQTLTENLNIKNAYTLKENATKWGKNIGGALATAVMLVTNFIIDAPFINWVNKKTTGVVDKISQNKMQKAQQNNSQVQAKGVK